jgi:LytS/YehU family sensor histidine kinase
LFIFSYLFLHEENIIQHEKEIESLRKSEYQIQALKNEIEPELFYIIMESLILYIQKNETISNEMIGRLSEFYRYRLENKHNELIKMRHEKLAAENLLLLLKHVYPDSISFTFADSPEYDEHLIVPLWLQKILFTILKCNILSPVEKFNISIDFRDNSLVLKHNKREKLLISEAQEIQKISSEIEFYTHKKISVENQLNEVSLTIPLFNEGPSVEEMPDKNELNQSVKK